MTEEQVYRLRVSAMGQDKSVGAGPVRGRAKTRPSGECLYRLQVSATAALLLSAMRKGVLDLTRSGPAPLDDAGPQSDRADSSLPRPAVSVQR